jgi:NAD(P)-dependent dehydrogenase (short-subunit alcohol dehydrogenase family)
MSDWFSLDGRVAIVTGASRSLGRGIANAMAEAGAKVVLCGRWEEGLERVKGEIEAAGGEALPVVCDVSDPAQVDELIRTTKQHYGRVDSLVANAGVFQAWEPSEKITNDEFDRVIDVNLRGVWLCCMAAGKEMIAAGTGGTLITVASIQGQVGITNTVAYTASKHGVIGLTKVLALDWAKYGIRANALAPAFIERDDEPLQQDPATVEYVTTHTPLARWGKPRELGTAAVFLASDASSYVTGTALAVDGGWLAQ